MTALVDLNKPAYRLGIAQIKVGWRPHRLDVSVTPQRDVYRVRDKVPVKIHVTAADGSALPAGTEVAVEAGDIVLVRSDPRDVPRIVALSKATYRKMVQNLWWAAGYNIVAIPLAAGVLESRGIVLSPAIGAVLMSLSTVIVAVNAQLLRRVRL